MRLKSLTNLNTLLLVTVCVALAVTLWWSQRALERPYLLMARYLSLSSSSRARRRRTSAPTWKAATPCATVPLCNRWTASNRP